MPNARCTILIAAMANLDRQAEAEITHADDARGIALDKIIGTVRCLRACPLWIAQRRHVMESHFRKVPR